MHGEGYKEAHLSTHIVSHESHNTNCYLSVIFSLRIFFLCPSVVGACCLRARAVCQRRACQQRRRTRDRVACLSGCLQRGCNCARQGSPRAAWLAQARGAATTLTTELAIASGHDGWQQLRARPGSSARAAMVPTRTRVKQWLRGCEARL